MADPSAAASTVRSAARNLSDALSRLSFLEESEGYSESMAQLTERRRLIDQKIVPDMGPNAPLLTVFLGGTNVGKSTMFNLAIGEAIACPSEVARGTRSPALYGNKTDLDLVKNAPVFKDYQRQTLTRAAELNEPIQGTKKAFFHVHNRDNLRSLVLVDAPDLDSNHEQNHATAKDALFCSDVVIFVTSNQKYRDAVCEELLARAARLGKRIYVIFNFQTSKAVDDFKSRYRILTGEVLQEHRLVKVDYTRRAELDSGPWVSKLRELLPAMIADKAIIQKESLRATCLQIPDELAPCINRYDREVKAVEDLRRKLHEALTKRADAYAGEVRQAGIPEMDEIMTLVMKELRVPGIDRIYDAIFDTTRAFWKRIRSFLGSDNSEKVRELRYSSELDRLKRHFNAYIDDISSVFDQADPNFFHPLRKRIPPEIFTRLDEERAKELTDAWREKRREIVETARDKIVTDLKSKKVLKGFIQASKLALRSASVVAVFHFGPQPAIDIAGSAIADFGLRSLLDKALGGAYQKSTEDKVMDGLQACFHELLKDRLLTPIHRGLPPQHSQEAFSALETAIAALRDAARSL